jgi:hypothetical protein
MGEEATNVVKSNNSPPSLSTPNGYFINTIKEEEEDGQGEWGKIS